MNITRIECMLQDCLHLLDVLLITVRFQHSMENGDDELLY